MMKQEVTSPKKKPQSRFSQDMEAHGRFVREHPFLVGSTLLALLIANLVAWFA
jgi:hypothetical protein